MKNINKIYLALLFLGSIFLGSCSKNLDVNNDPSTINLNDASVNDLFVNGIITTGINLGVNYNELTAVWSQFVTRRPGFAGIGTDNHLILGSSANIDRAWIQAYSRSMFDFYTVTKKSTDDQLKGASQLMLAYNYQLLTDCFGNIPFTEALKAIPSDGGILSPKFDNASTVYTGIIDLIDEAISNLNSTSTVSTLKSSNDPLFAGDLTKWIKFANTLKLRVLVRQFEVNPAAINDAAAFVSSGAQFISTVDEIPQIKFTPNGLLNNNPLYSKLESSNGGNIYVLSNTTLNALTSRGDTRINAFYNLPSNPDIPGTHAGNDQGSGSGAVDKLSKPSALIYSATAPILLMSTWESKFLQAETFARSSSSGEDESLFDEAVTASFEYVGLPSDAGTYLASNPYNTTDIESKVKSIAYEKWVAMNGLQPTEAWIESRRYDTPTRTVFAGPGGLLQNPASNVLSLGTGFPVIFPYSQSELSSNTKAPAQRVDISNPNYKTFWDN